MKTTTQGDLSRAILIHCCKDGTITYRTRDQPVFNGAALPVFSVNTEAEAKALQVRLCSRQYTEHPKQKGRPWYVLPFSGELNDLPNVTELFRKHWRPS